MTVPVVLLCILTKTEKHLGFKSEKNYFRSFE